MKGVGSNGRQVIIHTSTGAIIRGEMVSGVTITFKVMNDGFKTRRHFYCPR